AARTRKKGLITDIFKKFDPRKVAVMGHSQGGAAALEAARRDKRIKAVINLDGVPLGYVFDHGISTTALVLRSHVDYSDDDLARLHRTRAQWDERGRAALAEMQRLLSVPGGNAWVISIKGTNHSSFGDAPFTMPQVISHWGGKIMEPHRFLNLTAGL